MTDLVDEVQLRTVGYYLHDINLDNYLFQAEEAKTVSAFKVKILF